MPCLLRHNVSRVTLKALQIRLVSGDHYRDRAAPFSNHSAVPEKYIIFRTLVNLAEVGLPDVT